MKNSSQRWEFLLVRLKQEHIKKSTPHSFEASGGYTMKLKAYGDKDANGLQRSIEDFINYTGGEASRINSIGMPRLVGNQLKWTKGNTRRGIADIRGTYAGRSLSIEVKIGPDKLSEVQLKERERIIGAGGLYFVAKDFPSFLYWFLTEFPQCTKLIEDLGFATLLNTLIVKQ